MSSYNKAAPTKKPLAKHYPVKVNKPTETLMFHHSWRVYSPFMDLFLYSIKRGPVLCSRATIRFSRRMNRNYDPLTRVCSAAGAVTAT
jgi:hypothetical protein